MSSIWEYRWFEALALDQRGPGKTPPQAVLDDNKQGPQVLSGDGENHDRPARVRRSWRDTARHSVAASHLPGAESQPPSTRARDIASRPVALTLMGVLGHVTDYAEARSIVAGLLDGLPASYETGRLTVTP